MVKKFLVLVLVLSVSSVAMGVHNIDIPMGTAAPTEPPS